MPVRGVVLLLTVFPLTVAACYVERPPTGEANAINDTRTVISAEAAYQSVNSAYYGTISCLATPGACMSGYNGPTFLDPSLAVAQTTKVQYTRKWFEKRAAPGAPPGSIEAFCYASTPEDSHRRSFGGDSTGVLGESQDPSALCCTVDGRLDVAVCPPLK